MKTSYSVLLILLILLASAGYSQTAKGYFDDFDRGIMKSNLENYTGAIADFTKAIEIDPKHAKAYKARANAKENLKDYRGAIADYNKAIEIDPKFAEAYTGRGFVKGELKDFSGAIIDYTKAIDIVPEFANELAEAHLLRGAANMHLKDYRGAIVDYNKVIEIDTKNAAAYYFRGLAKIKFGQKDSGCLDFSKAGELGIAQAYEEIKLYCQ